MQVPLLGGRFFTRADALEKIRLFFPQSRAARAPAPTRGEAVIVNQAFAGRYFPGDDAIDKRFYVGSLSGKHYWYRIVGIVGNMRRQGPEQPPIAEWYGQLIGNTTDLVIRTDRDPLLLASTIGDAVRGSDKHLMVLGMMTADQRLGAVTAARRAQTGLLALFASLALLLAALGIYGIVGHSVALRTREIGVRMAFGADRPTLLRSVIAESMRLPLLGLTIGIAAAAAATRLLRHLLFDVTALDPGTFAAVGVVLTATALVACWLPARRAAALDPLMALREL
jgi:putative ABC transport system permease protein